MPGPSGYTTAFTRPDPLDPNDRKRQQTQSRPADYPYDRPVSYGRAQGTDMDGAAYQSGVRSAPPVPRRRRAADWRPKDPWNLAQEALDDPYCPGDQADDAAALGYGTHGRLGEDDVDMDDLRRTFRLAASADSVRRAATTLLAVLGQEPRGDDEDDAGGICRSGARHVFAPDAENDPETL